MSSAPPDRTGSSGGRLATLLGALAVLALALALRLPDLDADATSPDDGEFLHSARVHELAPGVGLGPALEEDRAWAGGLARDFGRTEERSSFQHGYLHQLCIRWAWRVGGALGQSRISALRADQALLGALTALLAFLWLRRATPGEPLVALAGGGLVAAQLAHVHASRTGWGQAACTFFLLAAFWIAWRMRDVREAEGGRLARHAAAFALATVLAYGFHEMATVYVASLALIMLVEFPRGDDGRRRWPWRSRRLVLGWAACAPVGALTLALLFFSDYARATWFSNDLGATYTWLEIRRLSVTALGHAGLATQVGWAVLLLAPIGLVGAALRDGRWARWLLLCAAVPSAVLFLKYNLPYLIRIYLPALVILCLFAAEGLGVLWALARTRWSRAAVDGLAIGAVALGAGASWQTMHGTAGAPLHLAALHLPGGAPLLDPRRPLTPLVEALSTSPPTAGEVIGVGWRWDPLYALLDAGLPAQLFNPGAPEDDWPRRVVGPVNAMSAGGARLVANGGRWELVALDRRGALGLYERVR